MKTFKHRKTGEIATYKDGCFKQGNCVVEIGVEPSSEFWEEVEKTVLFAKIDDISVICSDLAEKTALEFYEWADTSEQAAIFWRRNRVDLDMSGKYNDRIREKRKLLFQEFLKSKL